jgi:O-acetyl-ADP-ribose deacetylase (regulator of RNase III)
MLGGGGLDGAISHAGGDDMYAARCALPIVDEAKGIRCRAGDAVTTIGGDLPNEWCIHAVGPNYYMLDSLEEGDELLASAYRAVMTEAKDRNMTSVGICLLSAGIFRGDQSLRTIIQIAVNTIADNVYPGLQYACICAFTREEIRILHESFESLSKIQSEDEIDPSSQAITAESSALDDGLESSGGCKRKLGDSKLSSPSRALSSAAGADDERKDGVQIAEDNDCEHHHELILQDDHMQDSSKQWGDEQPVNEQDAVIDAAAFS